jgi:purine nucleoside phosphorylase
MGTAIGVAGTGISKTSSSKNTKTPFGKTTTKIKSGKYAGKRVPKGNG